jgi:putative toxin-antitoxin system antitoxin component (TIGR02293 family)
VISSAAVAHILGGRKILHRDVRSFRDLEQLVASGLPSASLMSTVRYVVPDTDQRARTKLADALVPRITRRRRTTSLKLDESERVERLARIMALAEFVWEDHAEAQVFMATPHSMLGGRTPTEAAATELGARQVEDILWKLEYSLPV